MHLGFEAKDISIRMDKYGRLVVRGDKQVSQHKYMSFEETYDVPSDANLEDAHAMFEDGQIYCVTIPKLTKEQQQQQHAITIPQHQNQNQNQNLNQNLNQNQNQNQNNINHPNPTQEKPVSSRDYLKLIRGDRSSAKKVALFVALLIALLVLLVFLIIKFRRR